MITYPAIGSLGKRNLILALDGLLEDAEYLSTADVVSINPARLEISDVVIIDTPVDQDGVTSSANRSVGFTVEGLVSATEWDGRVDVTFTGDSGTSDTVRVVVPITKVLTS